MRKLKCAADPAVAALAQSLKIISDPNRLRIICLLSAGERCVCEVERELDISQQLASHHLNVLKDAGFLEMRKEGTSSFYSVDRERLKWLDEIFLEYLDYRKAAGPEKAGGKREESQKQPVS